MKSKKFIPFLLGCLLMLETPFVSQAAQFSSVSTPVAEESAQVETTLNLTLNHSTGSLYVGGTLQLMPSISGYNDTENPPQITWTSSRPDIVSVSAQGLVKAHKTGNAVITVSAVLKQNDKTCTLSSTCQISVLAPSLKLQAKKTIYLKSTEILTASVAPSGTINWKSSNQKIVTVDNKGKLTPKKTGTATITASCHGLKQKCKVTVKKPSVKLDTKKVYIFANSNYDLDAKAHPFSRLSCRSSNARVARVSKDGIITGIRPGSATITASVPGAKTSCKVTVLKNKYKLNRSSQTLMEGGSADIYMSNISAYDNVSYEIDDPSVADISTKGNICKVKARRTGETILTASYSLYKDGQYVNCKQTCNIIVIDCGIVQQEASIARGVKETLTLKHVNKPDAVITGTTWSSSNPRVAVIDPQTGKVTGKKYGSANITATVSYSDGTAKQYITHLKVSQPKLKSKHTVVSVGHSQKVSISGLTTFSDVTWKLKKKSLASVSADGTISAGSKTGKTTLTIKADGKTFKHTVVVTNPKLKSSFVALAPKGTSKIKLSGVSSQSRITYRSKKSSVATVSKSGVITAHKYGTAKISITADGNRFTFEVNVAPQRAIDACKTGYGIMYSSSYSQARRMTTGYYDCSSLVFRSYGCDTRLLGGISSWAPTAAAMASYMERTGKVISYRGVNVSKLRPGDLLFFQAPYSNGRYKNIYHVSMYYGGGYRLEKPLRPYFPEGNLVMVARPVK